MFIYKNLEIKKQWYKTLLLSVLVKSPGLSVLVKIPGKPQSSCIHWTCYTASLMLVLMNHLPPFFFESLFCLHLLDMESHVLQ